MLIDYSFPKSARLRVRREYQRLLSPDKRYIGQWIVVDVRANSKKMVRLGITVSRRYGKAHDRNRFKRIVREAFRLCRSQLKVGIDLNVKPRLSSDKAHSYDIKEELLRFLAS